MRRRGVPAVQVQVQVQVRAVEVDPGTDGPAHRKVRCIHGWELSPGIATITHYQVKSIEGRKCKCNPRPAFSIRPNTSSKASPYYSSSKLESHTASCGPLTTHGLSLNPDT